MFGLWRRREGPGWQALLGDIGRSTVDLLHAEVTGAREELSELLRRSIGVAIVLLVALTIAFWALGAAATAAVAGLAVWLPLWGAALVLFAVLAVAAVAFGLVARSRFRRLEGPGTIVRRRVESHLEFWRDEVLGGAGSEAADGRGDDDVDYADYDDYAEEDVEPARKLSAAGGSRGRPRVSVAPPAADDEEFQP
jgi:hypothetical protein